MTAIPRPPRLPSLWQRCRLAFRLAVAALRSSRVAAAPAPAAAPPMLNATGWPNGHHPESMVRELSEADEEWLAALADEMWPDCEYLLIVPPPADPPDPCGRQS